MCDLESHVWSKRGKALCQSYLCRSKNSVREMSVPGTEHTATGWTFFYGAQHPFLRSSDEHQVEECQQGFDPFDSAVLS